MAEWTQDKGSGGVAGSQLTALMSTHPESPLQSAYGDAALRKYTDHAAKLHAGVMADGVTLPTTSKHIAEGTDPLPVGKSKWFGVGGAHDTRTGTGRVPEKVYSLSKNQFGANEALGHVLDVEGHNIDRAQKFGKDHMAVFAGGWNEHSESGEHSAVLDHSTVHHKESKARNRARFRGERAYFDAKNIVSKDPHTGKPVD